MYKVYITYESSHPDYVSEVDTYEEAFAKAVYYLNHAKECHEEYNDPEPVSTVIYKNFGHPVAEIHSPY